MINLLLLLLCALLDRPGGGSHRNDWLIDGSALLLTACLDTGNKLHNSSCVKRFSFVSPPLDLGKRHFQYFIHFFIPSRRCLQEIIFQNLVRLLLLLPVYLSVLLAAGS